MSAGPAGEGSTFLGGRFDTLRLAQVQYCPENELHEGLVALESGSSIMKRLHASLNLRLGRAMVGACPVMMVGEGNIVFVQHIEVGHVYSGATAKSTAGLSGSEVSP